MNTHDHPEAPDARIGAERFATPTSPLAAGPPQALRGVSLPLAVMFGLGTWAGILALGRAILTAH